MAAVPSEPLAWPTFGAARCPGPARVLGSRPAPGPGASRSAGGHCSWSVRTADLWPCPQERAAHGRRRRGRGRCGVRRARRAQAHACRGPVDESACPARGAQTHPRCTGREEARSPPRPLMWPWCWVWRVRIKHCITRVRVLGRPSVGPVPAPLPAPSHRGGLTPAEHIPCRVTQGGLVSSGPARDGAGHAERLTAEERAAGPGPRQPCPPRRYDGPFRKRNLYLRARSAVLFPSVKVSQMDFPALALRAAKCWAFLFSLHPVNLGLN